MRSVLVAVIGSLLIVASARAEQAHPTATWLAQAQCIHRHEGPWTANTGNGYFGGMQLAAATWFNMHGPMDAAFAHPGDPAYPFRVSPRDQLRVARLVWLHDGRTWVSWGRVGRRCAHLAE